MKCMKKLCIFETTTYERWKVGTLQKRGAQMILVKLAIEEWISSKEFDVLYMVGF